MSDLAAQFPVGCLVRERGGFRRACVEGYGPDGVSLFVRIGHEEGPYWAGWPALVLASNWTRRLR